MKFIAKKTSCVVSSQKKYYEQNVQLPICQTNDDLKNYYKLRLDIYQGVYDADLKHCHKRNCIQQIWQSELQSLMISNQAPKLIEQGLTILKPNDPIAMLILTQTSKEVMNYCLQKLELIV